jgi:8-oxo-dGTP pyrophosphatase MutT (NUDIX family)
MIQPPPSPASGNPWHRTATREIYRNAWFKIREDSVVRPDGTPGIYGVMELPDYAGVVAVDDTNRIALVRQWRYLYGEQSLEVPAGNASPRDTDALATAKRELQEETGLAASEWASLGRIRYSAVTNTGHLFLARGITEFRENAEPRPDRDDWTELVWMDYHAAIRLLLDGEIVESTAVAALGKAEVARRNGRWALERA